jgi:dienelactone hydrolase
VEGLYLKFGEAVYSKDMFEPLRKLLTEEAKSVTEEELRHFVIFVKSIYGFNVLDELDQITCPVLLLGSEDDHALGAAASYQIADRLNKRPDFEFYIYRGYGHAAYAFAPDYTDRIHAFFRKSEQSANHKRHIEYTSPWG